MNKSVLKSGLSMIWVVDTEYITEVTGGQMGKNQRFVILLDKIDGVEATQEHIKGHVRFLEKLENEDLLEMAGPFTDYSGGMLIIKANNFEDAKKIATSDPFVQSGVRKLELRTWELSCKENNHLGMGSL